MVVSASLFQCRVIFGGLTCVVAVSSIAKSLHVCPNAGLAIAAKNKKVKNFLIIRYLPER
jgi:hypothetical protein